jgi:vancomycin resistance protein VanW
MTAPPPSLLTLSRPQLLWRQAKVALHQARRLALWQAAPGRWPPPTLAAARDFPVRLAQVRVDLRRTDAAAHPLLEEGKVHNVRLAAPHFDGLHLSPTRPLSFWRTVGRLGAGAGYRHGLSLRGGCLTPSVGGGVCLLANALFELVARAGWHVHERHGHTLEAVPPEPGALWGMDATVAWPYVDLVAAPREGPVRLGARVEGEGLRLTLDGPAPGALATELWAEDDRVEQTPEGPVRTNRIARRVVHVPSGRLLEEGTLTTNRRRLLHTEAQRRSCLTCGEAACHARVRVPGAAP